jgi:hypothetical protein
VTGSAQVAAVASIHFLDALKAAAEEAEKTEGAFRREMAQRIAVLERERAFAFRRLNLMRAVADAVAGAESDEIAAEIRAAEGEVAAEALMEIAVACAQGALSDKLGWSSLDPARMAVLKQFDPVARSVFWSLRQPDAPGTVNDVQGALAAFETWYAGSHEVPFWALFDHYIPETPRVDF